jgi:hypothetical protein
VIDYESDLFGLLLILVFGPDRGSEIGRGVLEKFGIDFDDRNKFHDFLVFSRDVGVQVLLVFGVELGGFGDDVVLTLAFVLWLGLLGKFGFVEEGRLVGFGEMVGDEDVLAFGLFAFDCGQQFEDFLFEAEGARILNNFIIDFVAIVIRELKDVTEEFSKYSFVNSFIE